MMTLNKMKQQKGFILTSEAVMLSTILVSGLTAGMVTLRNSINAELNDVAEAIGSLDQSYSIGGINNDNGTGSVSGTLYVDAVDAAAGDGKALTFVAPVDGEGGS